MKSSNEIIKIARKSVNIQLDSINQIEKNISDVFASVIKLILNSSGRLIVSGVGKSANIAKKLVATFNSTGQPAVFLHAADAIHGDLGNIQNGDIVICISKSGNTSELKFLIPFIKKMGNKIIALSGNKNSFLAKESDYVLDVSVSQEACPNNLAPTSSTTAQLVMGDAIAITLLSCKDFSDKDFARFHPGGILGKKLYLKVSDLLSKESCPHVHEKASINEVIFQISKNRLGAVAVIEGKKLKGIITDGDLRRMLENEKNFSNLSAKDIMSLDPQIISFNSLAYDALQIMQAKNISQLVAMDNESYVGLIHIHEILKEGIL